MSRAWEQAIAEETMNAIIALAEEYGSEKEFLDDSNEFGKAVQQILVEYTELKFGED